MSANVSESLFIAARILHISAGATALFVGPGAMLTVKGARWHRIWGKIYVGAMTVVAVTAIPMAVYHPNPFLQMIAVFSFYLAFSGWRMLRRRKVGAVEGPRSPADWGDAALCVIALLGGLALLAGGARALLAGNTFGTVSLVFGVIGLVLAAADGREVWQPRRNAEKRIGAHIGRMGGAYIATVTAFCVVNVRFLPPVLVWLLPTLVGLPLILRAIRASRKKFAPRPAG